MFVLCDGVINRERVDMSYNMRQCSLSRGVVKTIAWLPERYAVKGNYVEIKQNGKWVNGWLVEVVSDISMTYEEVNERGRDYKRQRSASDI